MILSSKRLRKKQVLEHGEIVTCTNIPATNVSTQNLQGAYSSTGFNQNGIIGRGRGREKTETPVRMIQMIHLLPSKYVREPGGTDRST